MSLSSYPLSLCLTGTWCLASLLLFGLSLYSCMVNYTEDKGRSRVICSSEPIVSAPGNDVILTCLSDPQLNVENLTVVWWKPDIQLDPEDPLSNYRYVHSYRANHDEEDMKMSLYKGRTALNKDGLKHGNISLKIMNVRQSDQGIYSCEIPQWASDSVVYLVVETLLAPTVNHQTPDLNDGTDVKGGWIALIDMTVLVPVLVVFLILILILGGVAGYLLRHNCQNQNIMNGV